MNFGEQNALLWWILTAGGVAFAIAMYMPGMVTRKQRITMAWTPFLAFVPVALGSSLGKFDPVDILPFCCAFTVSLGLGAVGHWEAIRVYMREKADHPYRKQEDMNADVPWILQTALIVVVVVVVYVWWIAK